MTSRVFALILAASGPAFASSDWLEWRGPTRDGRVHKSAAAWPDRLNAGSLKKSWTVDLAEGYASPVVAGDRVFTVETRDKKNEIVRAFDRESGRQLWEKAWAGSMKVPFFASKNGSWVRSTPASDGKLLFVGGMRDVLVALDVETGKERWRSDFPKLEGTPPPSFGFVCSPMLVGEHLYVQAGNGLRKIRKADGGTVWNALKDDRAMFGSAFSSPIRTTIGGREQMLVQTRTTLAGIDAGDGKVLWSTPVEAFRGMNILTPTPMGDHVFTATYGGGTFFFKVNSEGGKQAPKPVWQDKTEGYMSSPVVIDGKVYLYGRDKRLHCLDPKAGKVLWSTRKKFGDYWSMVANKDRILALDEEGTLLLIRANPGEFQLIDELEISDRPTWAHLVVCDNEIYIRDLKGLTKFVWK
jgi:outer membrane protein assembly factor BamB